VFCGIAALLILSLLRPDPMTISKLLAETDTPPPDMADPERLPPDHPTRPLSALLTLPKVQLAIYAGLVSQTVMVVLMVMTPLHMEHYLHETRDSISLVIAAHTLGMFGLSPLTGYLIDQFGRIPMLIVAAATLVASALLAPVASTQFVLAAALFLLGLGWNFGYVSASSLLADALQGEERARVQGINDALVFFVAGIGSLSAGPLFASGGYGAVSLAGLVVSLSLVALVGWLRRPQLQAGAA
jgi:MFS family permease